MGPFIKLTTYSKEYRIQNTSQTHVHKITKLPVFSHGAGRNDFSRPKSSGERPAQLSVLLSQSVVNWPKYSAAIWPLCKNLSKLDQFFLSFQSKNP